MNTPVRPRQRSPLRRYSMFAVTVLAVIVSAMTIAWSPTQPEAQQRAGAGVAVATPYVSSDPSLPLPGTFALPTESAVQAEGF